MSGLERKVGPRDRQLWPWWAGRGGGEAGGPLWRGRGVGRTEEGRLGVLEGASQKGAGAGGGLEAQGRVRGPGGAGGW